MTRSHTRLLRSERGEGLISGLLLLAGVLVPLMFIVPLFGRIESAHLAAQQAARDAVRSAALAPDDAHARAAAQAALTTAQAQSDVALNLSLSGRFARGATMTATTSGTVEIGNLPGLGSFGTVTVHGRASAPIDRYRSLPQPAPAP
jgi:type II secretory pathway component PulM